MIKKCIYTLIAVFSILVLLASSGFGAPPTKLNNIRFGKHTGYTRLVLDSEGARPLEIGPASAKSLKITYDQLELASSAAAKFRGMDDAVDNISHHRAGNHSVITITFGRANTAVKTFMMQGESAGGAYRLILDLYPPGNALTGPGSLVPMAAAATASTAAAATSAAAPGPAAPQSAPGVPSAGSTKQSATASDARVAAADRQADGSAEDNQEAEPGESIWNKFSGEISVIGRLRNDDAKSDSLFLQYRDVNPITGDYDIKYVEPDQYYFQTDGKNLGQDDVNLNFRGGRYGILKGSITYDELPHRFAFDAKTLYSGVGSDKLTLNNTLQTTLQGLAGDPAAQADTLKNAYGSADSGDPEIKRKKLSGDFDFVALDPFSLRAEFSREKQDGSRPFFGSFSLDNTVELFEPIDNETWAVKLIAEYAEKAYLLNTTYYYQHFTNNEDTLTFDNPFRVDDAVGGPARGQIDLAPDNHYQNLSMSGSYNELPLRSRISVSAARGWMRQDDDLPAFTTNTALVAPINYSDRANLPESQADVKVDTTLLDAKLTSRPLDFMHLNAKFRYYNYDNKTDKIDFQNGYVETDSFAETPALGDPISTLPSSYEKTKADLNLGFDVWTRTRLNLDYSFDRTDRDNREVDKQTSNVFGGSIDTSPVDWGDLKLSYKRTNTDIDNYDYNVYLKSGQDLQQLAGLRKYTQADVKIDRIQLMANVYPIDPLAFSSSFVYGKNNFDNSSYGLTEANYYSLSIDGDYTLTDQLQLNAFYIYEKYKNKQKARGDFDEEGDGITTLTDWKAEGTDDVNTFGGGLKWAVMPEKLNLKLNYSYSKVDGKIDFSVPSGTVSSFDEVGDSTFQTLDARLMYNIWRGYYVTLGYIWEKFDYEDYDKDGFTNVPTDASGNYNGAVLSDALWDDYDAQILYLKFSYVF